jgi:hypothetical protein
MIDREHAARIAVGKFQSHCLAGLNLIVCKVASIDEIMDRRPVVYIVGDCDLERCWIVYFDETNCPTLRSSMIMLIPRATGEELYFGSAGDEG